MLVLEGYEISGTITPKSVAQLETFYLLRGIIKLAHDFSPKKVQNPYMLNLEPCGILAGFSMLGTGFADRSYSYLFWFVNQLNPISRETSSINLTQFKTKASSTSISINNSETSPSSK